MGIAYRSNNSTGLSISVWVGEVNDDQRREHMAALTADADWGAGGLVLTDLTGVSSAHRPSAKQVLDAAAEFSSQLAGQVRNAKWAMVAGETFVLAQRFGSYLEEEVHRMIVFNDLDAACFWLGVDVAGARVTIEELREGLRAADASSGTPLK
jgi:hypothetical protein